jgi:ArsR family transcriptional regulator
MSRMALSAPGVAEAKAELFRALAHPLRIRVLEILVDGEQSVGALAQALQIDLPRLSQQLAVLRGAHVVSTRRDRSTVYYRLTDPRTSQLLVTAKQLIATDLRSSQPLLANLEQQLAAIVDDAEERQR